jgi:voltage-gated potassium channel
MALLALLVIPVLVMEDRATTPEMRHGAILINWVIWLVFVVEFALRWAADHTLAFPRRAWFDLLLIALTPPIGVPDAMQGIRSLRLLRLFRLVRAFGIAAMGFRLGQRHFGQKKFHYVLLVGCATVVGGAVAVFALEGGENTNIRHFGDALWWAITTVTTVGYGDITPVTPEGQAAATTGLRRAITSADVLHDGFSDGGVQRSFGQQTSLGLREDDLPCFAHLFRQIRLVHRDPRVWTEFAVLTPDWRFR